MPTAFKVSQNYPNPFNAGTIIEYQIPQSSNVTIQLFNIKGQTVKTFLREKKDAGSYFEFWDGTSDRGIYLPSGIYFYRISYVDQQFTKKMILLR